MKGPAALALAGLAAAVGSLALGMVRLAGPVGSTAPAPGCPSAGPPPDCGSSRNADPGEPPMARQAASGEGAVMDHQPRWDERERDPGPGLLELGIIISAIVVLAALALMLFGGQTSAILSTFSGGV